MKKIYLMGLTSFFALAATAQTTLKVTKPLQNGKKVIANEASVKKGNTTGAKGGTPNSPMAIAANMAVSTTYTAGATQNINMVLQLTNTDSEFGDKLDITFPAGITVNSTTNTPNLGPDDGVASSDGPEAFVGISGQTITWGNDDNYYGGIVPVGFTGSPGSYPIQINITVPLSMTGNIVCTYSVSGDGFGASPADFTGNFTIFPAGAPLVNLTTSFIQPLNLTTLQACNYGLDTLLAQVKNVGNTTESNFNVMATVNGGTAMTAVVPGPLAPGDSTYVIWLPAYNFGAAGTYDLKAWTAQANDIALNNDTATLGFSNSISIALTSANYTNGIETAAEVGDISLLGNAAAFTGLSTGTFHSGVQALFTTVATSQPAGTYSVIIGLPCMDVVNGETYRISFWKRCNGTPAANGQTGVLTGLSMSAMSTVLKPLSAITPLTTWIKDSVDFVATASETRYFGILGAGAVTASSQMNVRLDDINITKVTSGVGIKSIASNDAIAIFPIPTSGILNINAIEATSSVEVINVIGEKVYSSTLVKGNNVVDLSGLANGAYFVKLNSNGQMTTKKVVLSK